MTDHRAIKQRALSAILSTVIVATVLSFSRPADAGVFTATCNVATLVAAVGIANNNVQNDVIRVPSCAVPHILGSTLVVGPDFGSGTTPHKLVIRGLGDVATITQNHNVRLFRIQRDANVLFKNLTLAKGRGSGTLSGGGAIYIEQGGTVRVEDSRVVDSSAGNGPKGGGIFNDRGTLTVADSTFVDNAGVFGGAIANDGRLIVTGARFFRNRARGGGAIANSPTSTATVVDSVFGYNDAPTPMGGGAIRNESPSLMVTGSTFSYNTGSPGGALLNVSGLVTISDSTLTNNGATTTNGGAIANGLPSNAQAKMVIDHSTVSANDGSNGGGISNVGRLSFTRSDATGNRAVSRGGAFHNEGAGQLSITESVLSGNSTSGTPGFGGGIYNGTGTLDVADSRLSDNQAAEGGAIHADSGTTTLADSVVSNNHSVDRGGGIKAEFNAKFTVDRSKVVGNTSGGHGGGFYNNAGAAPSHTGKLTVRESTISENQAAVNNNGGAFYNQGRIEVIDSTVADNVAAVGAGFATGNPGGAGSLTLVRTELLRNRAATHGGGISAGGGPTVSLTDTTVMDNTAGALGGGGIGTFGASLTVNRSTFANNSTTGDGGAINHGGPLTMTNVTITDNRAARAGGISYAGSGTIVNATFADNADTTSGASIFVATGGNLHLVNSIVSNTGPFFPVQCLGGTTSLSSISTPGSGCGGFFVNGFLPAVLGPLADNGGPTPTMALRFGPAGVLGQVMDAGDISNCPPTDQRGFSRPEDGPADADHDAHCDRGAYEWQ